MTDTVRIHVSPDYETGECTYTLVDANVTDPYVFDIPADQWHTWESARLAWDTVVETLGTMYNDRQREVAQRRETERLAKAAEEAAAAYKAHLLLTRGTPQDTGGTLPS